jgi:hypothetical protein
MQPSLPGPRVNGVTAERSGFRQAEAGSMGMFRSSLLLATIAASLVGCGSPTPNGVESTEVAASPASTSPRATSTSPAPPSVSSPDPDGLVMNVDGIGPYRIGSRVEDLRAAGLLGQSSPIDPRCPEVHSAAATGPYSGEVLLTVRRNVLVEIGTAGGDQPVRSPEGAAIGTSWDEIRKLYGGRGAMRKDPEANQGFLVPVGNRVMLFDGHPTRPGVGYFAVGLADYTERHFTTGQFC